MAVARFWVLASIFGRGEGGAQDAALVVVLAQRIDGDRRRRGRGRR